jgi:hypothetical protein
MDRARPGAQILGYIPKIRESTIDYVSVLIVGEPLSVSYP